MASTLAKVRCRNQKCTNLESEETPFSKCGNCLIARYCSAECQKADWPVHKLLCVKGRVLVSEDGAVSNATDAIEQMAKELTTDNTNNNTDASVVAETKAPAPQPEPVYLGEDVSDNEVMQQTIARLQVETNLFYAYQHELFKKTYKPKTTTPTSTTAGKSITIAPKNGKAPLKIKSPVVAKALNNNTTTPATTKKLPPTLLFIQTESTVADMRYQTLGPNDPQMDRAFVCYYMTFEEFTKEVCAAHPNPLLRHPQVQDHLKKAFATTKRDEHVVTVAVFGCGNLFVNNIELPEWDSLLEIINDESYQVSFKDTDCLEVYIDRS